MNSDASTGCARRTDREAETAAREQSECGWGFITMWFYIPPTKRPTASEYSVILALIAGVFIVLGGVMLVMAFRAPPANHDIAVMVAFRGALCIGVGVAVTAGLWLYRRFLC